jgi:hypothetical protein
MIYQTVATRISLSPPWWGRGGGVNGYVGIVTENQVLR